MTKRGTFDFPNMFANANTNCESQIQCKTARMARQYPTALGQRILRVTHLSGHVCMQSAWAIQRTRHCRSSSKVNCAAQS